MIQRKLSEEYGLPFLSDISRYGQWQRTFPNIRCGLKRGFSYYYQEPGKNFSGDRKHTRELLVAASVNDENSDTNWFRSDVDHFLFKQAVAQGVFAMENTEIAEAKRSAETGTWKLVVKSAEAVNTFTCEWLIDATGSDRFSQSFLGTTSSSNTFETHSSAHFSHFEGAGEWFDFLKSHDSYVDDYPYHPDHSALHQLLEEGWMWMLRFNTGILSAGIVFDESESNQTKKRDFFSVIERYPSLNKLFEAARLSNPPSRMIKTGRLQRKLDKVYGDGWIALNHSGGFVDPLHSTGIAHTLCTVEKVLALFKRPVSEKDMKAKLMDYQTSLFKEIELIDLLVSAGYITRRHFPLFHAAVMLYFVATVRYEQNRLKGERPDSYLCATDPEIVHCIRESYSDLKSASVNNRLEEESEAIIKKIRRRIEPLNSVGLMDESKHHMYSHTAVEM
jgi:FADH2 O2-dependent halogenase